MPIHAGSGTADTAVNIAEDSLARLSWLKLDDDLGASDESVHARRDADFLPFEAISTDGQGWCTLEVITVALGHWDGDNTEGSCLCRR